MYLRFLRRNTIVDKGGKIGWRSSFIGGICYMPEPTSKETQINEALANMKNATDEQLYLELSHEGILEYRKFASKRALKSLSEEDRRKMFKKPVAGIYGPISAVFGRLEDKYKFDLSSSRRELPSVGQGKNIFSSNWAVIEKKICKEWHYCERKKEFSDENKLIVSVIALVLSGTDWGVRVATAVVLLAWHLGPKFMCNCPDLETGVATPQSSVSSAAPSPGSRARESTKRARRKGRRVTRRRD